MAQRLGGQAVAAINADPGDRQRQRQVGQGIEAVARVDGQFAAELAQLQARLDRVVGRQLINTVHAQYSVQSFGGNAYGGDHYQYEVPDPTDWSKSPSWVRVLMVIGMVIALVGFGIAFVSIVGFITAVPGLDPSESPPDFGNVGTGFVVFFVGLVVLMVAGVGRSLSRRR